MRCWVNWRRKALPDLFRSPTIRIQRGGTKGRPRLICLSGAACPLHFKISFAVFCFWSPERGPLGSCSLPTLILMRPRCWSSQLSRRGRPLGGCHERRVERPSDDAETDAGVTAPQKGPPKWAKLRDMSGVGWNGAGRSAAMDNRADAA